MLTPRHHLEQFPRHVHRRAAARRGHVDLARIGLGIGDELGDGLGRHVRVHHHHVGEQHRPGNRRAVANEIERQLVVERRIDGVVGSDEADGVAVGERAQRRRHADISTGADLVLDDKLLAQAFRQILSDDARHSVVWSAGSKRHDPMYRSRGIGLCPCDARDGRQRGSHTYQMQKLTAGKCHKAPLRKPSAARQARCRKDAARSMGVSKAKRIEPDIRVINQPWRPRTSPPLPTSAFHRR
jgi:hypothetical protein